MWTPRRLLRAISRRQLADEAAESHREHWLRRVQRLGPDDATPVEVTPFAPLDRATGWERPSRPQLRGKQRRGNEGMLAPEDLARRDRDAGTDGSGRAASI